MIDLKQNSKAIDLKQLSKEEIKDYINLLDDDRDYKMIIEVSK